MSRAFAGVSIWSIICLSIVLAGCATSEKPPGNSTVAINGAGVPVPKMYGAAIKAIAPFFMPLPRPAPNDWLWSFKEPGQSFEEYLNSRPTVPTAERNSIYILPLSKFTQEQDKIVKITAGYIQAFYGLTVKTLPLRIIPRPSGSKNIRKNAISKKEQIRSGYILEEILRPTLPADAAALIAFTNADLYPDNSMNFVFGQASLGDRVGVWSLYRLDDNADFDKFLRRTIKIATHETGHMFSMHHCIAYNCVMSGSNHLAETDSHPIDACPECMAKVCWFSHFSPAERYRKLAKFCRVSGMKKEADEFERKLQAVKDLEPAQ